MLEIICYRIEATRISIDKDSLVFLGVARGSDFVSFTSLQWNAGKVLFTISDIKRKDEDCTPYS